MYYSFCLVERQDPAPAARRRIGRKYTSMVHHDIVSMGRYNGDMEVLQLGLATIDITPENPVPLAGFIHRQGPYIGVAQPLTARVFLFEQRDDDGNSRRALLISADLIWWGPERVPSLKRRIRERWNIPEDAVIFHATHTHGGPQTTACLLPEIGQPDPDYLQYLDERVLQAVGEAAERIEPVSVERGLGDCRIGINRRKIVDGLIAFMPNPDGLIDPDVTVFRFRAEDGSTRALLVHYTCHPTTTDDLRVSAEYPGVAMRLIEQELGPGTVAAFLQGCCGDIRPALVREDAFYRGTDDDVRVLGARLAAEVSAVLRRPMEQLQPCRIQAERSTVDLPFQRVPSLAELEARQDEPDISGAWSRMLLAQPERLKPTIPFHIQGLTLADGLALLAMDGEVVVEYGLWIKQRFDGKLMPLPYSNGMVGYVPVAHQVAEGGYEARDSCPYFGLPAPFAPSLEELIKASIDAVGRHLLEQGEQT